MLQRAGQDHVAAPEPRSRGQGHVAALSVSERQQMERWMPAAGAEGGPGPLVYIGPCLPADRRACLAADDLCVLIDAMGGVLALMGATHMPAGHVH